MHVESCPEIRPPYYVRMSFSASWKRDERYCRGKEEEEKDVSYGWGTISDPACHAAGMGHTTGLTRP